MTTVGSVDIRVRLLRDQLNRDIADLRSSLDGLRVDIDSRGASGGLDRARDSASELNATIGGLAAAAGIALSVVADKATEVAIAFDSARAKAATLTDDSNGLAASMRQLAGDLKGQANSVDLLNSSYDIISSGYSKTADVTELLKNSTYAAVGGFSDVNTVADATTTILNSYGKKAEDAAHITDVLIATQNAGKITVAQYAGLIGSAATTAAAAGVSFEEFSAYVAGATAKGVQASSAVAGISAAITAILSPTDVASRLAKSLGVQFDAAALKSKGLSGILAELNAKGAATPSVLTELFGSVEAVAAIMPSAGQNAATFSKNLAYIEKSAGMAKDAADKVSDSFEGRMKQSANQAQEAFLSLGQGIVTVINPVLTASSAMIGAFNSLPEPVKNTMGVAIGLSGAVLTLGGAIATINALTPITTAGFAAVSAALGLNTAATTANAAITTTAGVANKIFNFELTASNVGLGISAVQSGVASAARAVYAGATGSAAASTLAFAGTLATLAMQAAVAGAAIYVVTELFKRSEGAQFAFQVEANTQKMQAFTESLKSGSKSLDETAQKTKAAASGFDLMGQTMAQSGPIEAARVGLAELDRVLGGTSKATSAYGEEWGILTGKQRGAQLAMFALDAQFQETGKTTAATTELLNKYGLSVVDASDKQRLGTAGIQKFKEEAAGQIKVLDNYIDTLKSQKAPTVEQQQLIDNEIKLLEGQKRAIRNRIVAVEADTNSNKNNSKALQQVIIDVKELSAAYEKGTKDIDLATAKNKANIAEEIQKGVLTAEQAQVKTLQIEAKGLDDRKKLIAEVIPKIEASKVGAKPEEVEKANEKIKELEGESANVRSQIAQNLVSQKKAANELSVKNEEDIAKRSSRNIVNLETDKIIAVKKLQLQGALTAEQAEAKINQIKLGSNQSEIAAEEDRLKRYKVLRANNAITAKEYADVEAEISGNLKQIKLKNVEDEIQKAENARENELKNIERRNSAVEANITLKTNKNIAGVKAAIASGVLSEKDGAKQIADIQNQSTIQQYQQLERQLADVNNLEKRKVLTAKEASDQRTALAISLSQKEIELIDQQLAERQRLLDSIQEQADFEKRALDDKILLLEKEKSVKDELIQKGQLEKDLLESRLNLAKSLASVDEAKTSARFGATDRAISARRKLDSEKDIDPGVRRVLQAQLNAAGYGSSSEADILSFKRDDIRKNAAEQEKAAQAQEKVARSLLEIELNRAKLTAEIAVLEAQIADSKASQSQIQARANLEKAQQTGDKNAIATAQSEIKNADQTKELTAKSIDQAKESLSAQTELAANAKAALNAQQEQAKVQREAALAAQDQALALEIAEARAKEIARVQKGEQFGPTSKAGPAKDIITTSYDQKPSEQTSNLPKFNNNGLEDLAKISADLSSKIKPVLPEKDKFSDNSSVVEQLQKMNDNFMAVAARPSEINVTSANPVSDAADLYSKVSRNAVKNNNL